MRRKLDYKVIKELNLKGYNDNEIARIINASPNGVRYVRINILNLPHAVKDEVFTDDMISVIIGTLLGDAWIGYVYEGCKYPKYSTCHSISQEIYTKKVYSDLEKIMSKNILYMDSKKKIIKNKIVFSKPTIQISSRNCKNLTPYREAFYPNGKKIIPIDFIRNKFTEKSLAYWYMDDGSCDHKGKSYIFNTQCFTKENLTEFINFLDEKYNLKFTIKKDNSLYLRHCSNEKFENLIKPFITEDMQYKLCRH